MSFKYLFLLIAVISLKRIEAQDQQKRIDVTVLYESLCPDSIKFVTSQLYPTLQTNLSNYIELELIPYGKAEYNENTKEIKCRHQPIECEINKLQLCAMDINGKKDENSGFNKLTVAFINCLMAEHKNYQNNKNELVKSCSSLSGIQNISQITNCSEQDIGNTLFQRAREETNGLVKSLDNVPKIIFNKKYVKEEDKAAYENFAKALCQHIEGDKPAECHKSGAASFSSLIHLISLSILGVILSN